MPAYDYGCRKCGAVTEVIHHMGEEPKVVCPKCGSRRTQRLITTFPHVKFDYKAWYTAEEGTRKILHSSRAGNKSPASEQAGRT